LFAVTDETGLLNAQPLLPEAVDRLLYLHLLLAAVVEEVLLAFAAT
jgi:hypothetical protein